MASELLEDDCWARELLLDDWAAKLLDDELLLDELL